MSNYLYCCVCDVGVEVNSPEEFNSSDLTGTGPYCDRCWHWQAQLDRAGSLLDTLEKKVAALEVQGVATG